MINLIILVVFAEERRRDRTSELLVVLDWANNILGAMFTIEMGASQRLAHKKHAPRHELSAYP